MLSVITALEFFQHYFANPSHQATNAPLPHAKRPPPGGYVQTRLCSRTRQLPGLSDVTRRNHADAIEFER